MTDSIHEASPYKAYLSSLPGRFRVFYDPGDCDYELRLKSEPKDMPRSRLTVDTIKDATLDLFIAGHPTLLKKLQAVPHMELVIGTGELWIKFHASDLPKVAEVVKFRCKKTVSPEARARLRQMRQKQLSSKVFSGLSPTKRIKPCLAASQCENIGVIR